MAGSKGHKDKGSQALLKTLLANIQHPAVIVDFKLNVISSNSAFQQACIQTHFKQTEKLRLTALIDEELASVIEKFSSDEASFALTDESLKNSQPFPLGRSYDCSVTKLEREEMLFINFKEVSNAIPHQLNQAGSFKQLFDNAPMPGLIATLDRKIVLANKAFSQLSGYSLKDLIGIYTFDLTVTEDFDHRQKMYEKIYSEEIKYFEADKIYRHKDGSSIPVRARRSMVKLGNQQFLLGYILNMKPFLDSEQKIADQHAFLDQIINLNPNFIFAKDVKGRFTLINQKTIDTLGISRESVMGKTDHEILPNNDEADGFKEADLKIMQSRKPLVVEEVITDKHNRKQQLRTIKTPIIGVDGEVKGIMGVSEIITEQIQVKEALSEAQELNLIGSWDFWPNTKKGRYHFSKQLSTLLGIEADKHILQGFFNGIPEPYEEMVRDAFLKCREEFLSFAIVHPYKNEERGLRWFSNKGKCYRNQEGIVYRISGTFQDITERVLSEKALIESEKRLNLALRSAKLSKFSYDISTRIIYVEEETFHHFPLGKESAEVYLDTVLEHILPDDAAEFKAGYDKVLSSTEPTGGLFRFDFFGKGILYIEILCSVILDAEGVPTKITGVTQDITKRIKTREKMAAQAQESSHLKWEAEQREHELEAKKVANKILKELNEQIQEKNQAISLQAEYLAENNKALGTERQKLEAAHMQLSLITNNVPVGIAHLDLDLKLLFVNETILSWFDKESADLLNENAQVLFGENLYMLKLSHFGDLIKGKTVSTEWTLKVRAQESRATRITLVPNIGPYENLEGMILLIEDISSMKAVERSQTRLQESQLKEIEAMSKLDGMRKNQLKREIEHKDRELANVALFMGRKNELIKRIKSILKQENALEEQVKEMTQLLQNVESADQWKEFEMRFNNVHSHFYDSLRREHPNLSKNDLRLSAFLFLNMSTKEIADLTFQNPKSLKVARSRLRKKLDIANQKITINEYLHSFLREAD